MSKCPMRGHFRYLRLKTFPMTSRTPNARCFAPCCRALNIRESRRTPNPNFSKCWASPPHLARVGLRQSPKVGVALGVWRFTPSHFLTLPGVCDATLRLPLGLHPCNPFALVASPKLGLRHFWLFELEQCD
jgi:hypothetical protein